MFEYGVGTYIKSLRKSSECKTLKEIENKTGISVASMSRIENGKQWPQPETLKKLAPYLKVPYTDLLVVCGYMRGSQTASEEKVLDELRMYPGLYSELVHNPKEGIRKLNKQWEGIKERQGN
jgi:transcriptional regulator with XRE-family HTH domain